MKKEPSQRGGRNGTSAKRIGKASTKLATDWERLRTMSDEEIRPGILADPDAHPTDAAFWKNAKVVWPKSKEAITIRLDADLLAWLRKQKGYQTRINAILRTYMDAHRSA